MSKLDRALIKAAVGIIKYMDRKVDENLPEQIIEVVKDHSTGAAIAAIASGWIPGAGATLAVTISAGIIWKMYVEINTKLGLELKKNILKILSNGMATNLITFVMGSIIVSTVLTFIPGIGSIGGAALAGAICYSLTLASGYIYLKLLTNIFHRKMDINNMSAEDLNKMAKDISSKEDVKSIIKEAKKGFKQAKKDGKIK